MKKILLTKSNSSLSDQILPVVNNVENTNKNIYVVRKTMQPAYQELFKALLRLPDRQVQARVLDAINDKCNRLKSTETIQICDTCKQQKIKRILVDAATQTTTSPTKSLVNSFKDSKSCIISNSDDRAATPSPKDNSTTNVETTLSDDGSKAKKRKQRRKLRIPKVIKKSQAKQMQQEQPIIQKRKSQLLKSYDNIKKHDEASPESKRQRSDSFSSTDLAEAEALLSTSIFNHDEETIMKDMRKEYFQAEVIQPDGLIPIHSAIINNDLLRLRRQIYVWKKLKNVDLNELCTEDDEDCLQLAVIQNKSNIIVNILVQHGLEVNSLDDQSNTLIHLAVFNDVDTDVLESLMDKIDLNMLLKLNDDGFTPLHLTIRQDNFLQAETILNTLDKRSFGRLFYEREPNDTKDKFLNFYEQKCETLAFENSMLQQSKEKQYFKRRLIDSGEMRSGNTTLFYAIENKLEHFIYLLLAHFADPRIENLSGLSCRDYFGEFAKMLNLSLKIDRVMEKIENFLER